MKSEKEARRASRKHPKMMKGKIPGSDIANQPRKVKRTFGDDDQIEGLP